MFRRIAVVLVTPVLLALVSCVAPGFVTVDGTRFMVRDRPHLFVGVNFWQGMNLAVDGPGGDRARLGAELDRLKELGVTNVRVMASSEGPNGASYRIAPALMISPGAYDAAVFDGLDYLVSEVGARGMRAVMVLNNFWEWSGGMAQYVSWHEGSAIPYPSENDWGEFCDYAERFYTIETCQGWYRDHITAVINRVNRYTGRRYKDEPAIFAWELANEPRYYPMSWIEDTARHIRSLDRNHLITTGSEGSVGGAFVATHGSAHIDYATIHVWPQNWGWFDPKEPATFADAERDFAEYFRRHETEAREMGKPLVVEEFGLARDWEPLHNCYDPTATTTLRDRFFGAVYESVLASASSGGPACGSNLWCWSGAARPGGPWVGDPPHEKPGWYSVYERDGSTLSIIAGHADDLRSVAARRAMRYGLNERWNAP